MNDNQLTLIGIAVVSVVLATIIISIASYSMYTSMKNCKAVMETVTQKQAVELVVSAYNNPCK